MKIGVISDSHGDTYAVKQAIKSMGDVDIIVHLGDFSSDAERVSKELNREIIFVRGNCDFSSSIPSDKIIEVENKKILLTHGHNYYVKSDYINLHYKALEDEVDIVLFGHTHFAETFEIDNIVFLNPGSLSMQRGVSETYAVVTIENGRIIPNIFRMT